MASLLGLAHEVLHYICTSVDPEDLARLSRCCRALRDFVDGNDLLYKEQYLRQYDIPLLAEDEAANFYRTRLKDLTSLRKHLRSQNVDTREAYLETAGRTTYDLLKTATVKTATPSRNVEYLSELFSSKADCPPGESTHVLLTSSSLYDVWTEDCARRLSVPTMTEAARQASAQLHCLFGRRDDGLSADVRAKARSRVYDLRNFTQYGTFWGPFMDDGSTAVDWEKLEAIMIVLDCNLRHFISHPAHARVSAELSLHLDEPFWGTTVNSFVSPPPPPSPPDCSKGERKDSILELRPDLAALDPFNVTGTWHRIVVFLDYTDFFAHNFSSAPPPSGRPREPIYADEAIRLISMKLHVTKIEHEARTSSALGSSSRLPTVYFEGRSRSMDRIHDPNANSRIRGTVSMTPQGEVRWTTLSVIGGEDRWRSEGIQVGGINSARGVVGTWFDKDYSEDGPAGPTSFWKVGDWIEKDKPLHLASDNLIQYLLYN